MRLRSNKGFTLIELMIVLVVISIITLFAVFSYTNRVKKAKITLAEATLKEMANAIEKERLKGVAYTANSIKEAYRALLTKSSGTYFVTYSDDKIPIYSVEYEADFSGYNLSIKAVGNWIEASDENAVMCINHLLSFNKGKSLCESSKASTSGAGSPSAGGSGSGSGPGSGAGP